MDNRKIYSLTQFMINHTTTQDDVFTLFNQWTMEDGIRISNFQEAIWIIEYMKTIQQVDVELLKETQKIDKEKLEKEICNGKKILQW